VTEERKPDLRIVGGHPVLDLVNTVTPRLPGGQEHLTSPGELLAWSQRVTLVDERAARAARAAWRARSGSAGQALHATLDVRESVYEVLRASLADSSPDTAALEHLTLRWAAAAARSTLVSAPDQPVAVVVGTDPAFLVPDRLAFAAVELLRTIDLGQLKECPVGEGGCGWLFLDKSRNGSRRWCAMADCGTQAKARKLTARRRAERASTVQA